MVFSAVGRPKDHVARILLGRDVVFGNDLVEHRLALKVVRPFEKGVLNETALRIILNNTRTPDMNHSDLLAIVAACRAAAKP